MACKHGFPVTPPYIIVYSHMILEWMANWKIFANILVILATSTPGRAAPQHSK